MAIVVEEEKSRGGAVKVVLWLLVLGIVAYGAYYLFFANPEYIEVKLPANFTKTKDLVNMNINPDDVLGSQKFRELQNPIPAGRTPDIGRANPFASF